ncbi:MAG TPA: lipoyl(octanoyl) transferase LipB [Planctomycetota bacterium]|nr:lipoyl(octanoyl) transferase LipB [Planctomycetota bacterium]
MKLALRDLERRDYEPVLELQRELAHERAEGRGEDTLLVVEHPEVVTVGRTAQRASRDASELALVRQAGIPVVEIERGGAITWHGPGQLVGYPIVRLAEEERDVHRFLRTLEGALADAVRETTGLEAEPHGEDTPTGLWVKGKKVASIGIAVKRWVTLHGFALNLSNDLSRFNLFRPCDLQPEVMGSLDALGAPVERGAVVAAVHRALARRLGREAAE